MKHYVGLDLHSRNTVIAVIDEAGNRIYWKRVTNAIGNFFEVLSGFPGILGVVLESTYNWYWLADGLIEAGYSVHISTPSKTQLYKGLKNTNDKTDAFWLAEMLRLGILPEGHILPREERLLRDLARKRGLLVQQRTQNLLSAKNLFLRALCYDFSAYEIKTMEDEEVDQLVKEMCLNLSIKSNLAIIRSLQVQIDLLEKEMLLKVKDESSYQRLLSVKGIGKVIALSVSLEVGDIGRFKGAGHFASYCRCVPSKRISNNKGKGENNRKNGNKYLAWAMVEAAMFVKKQCPYARKFYEKKKKTSKSTAVAVKALANKLSKAFFYIMRDGAAYDGTKIYKGNLTERDRKAVAAKTNRGLAEKPNRLIGKAATAPSNQ